MYMYLTDIATGERLQIPLLPDRISVTAGASVISTNIINLGEVKFPRGSSLDVYYWNGTFPGEHAKDFSFVSGWAPPASIVSRLDEWMKAGKTLKLLVTEVTINDDVFIENFSHDYYGGMGDVSYSISLTKRRPLTISTIAPPATPPTTTTPTTPTTPATAKTYGTVQLSNKNLRLYVRKKASTDSTILGSLAHGTQVEILEKSGNWYIIPYSKGTNGKGYVYASNIKLGTTGTTPASKSTKPATSTPSSSPDSTKGGTTYTVKSGDSLPMISKKFYGSTEYTSTIYNANKAVIDAGNKGKTVSKYTIYAGTKLRIPAIKVSGSSTGYNPVSSGTK